MKQEAKIVYLLECLQKTAPPVLVFCENKADVDDIHEYLLLKGVEAVAIHGGMDQVRSTHTPFRSDAPSSLWRQLREGKRAEGKGLVRGGGRAIPSVHTRVSHHGGGPWLRLPRTISCREAAPLTHSLSHRCARRSASSPSTRSRGRRRTCWWPRTWRPRGWTFRTSST